MTGSIPDADQQAHLLIARFLTRQGYSQTLSSFLSEATSKNPQLRIHSHETQQGEDWNDLVEDWIARKVSRIKLTDQSQQLEDQLNRVKLDDRKLPRVVKTVIKEATNILNVKKGQLPKMEWDSASLEFKSSTIPCIFTTTVDKTLKIWSHPTRSTSSRNPLELLESHSFPSPVLSFVQHPSSEYERFIACGTMTGGLEILDLVSRERVVQIKNHSKYIVKVAWSPDGRHIATIGYDKLLHVYSVSLSGPSDSSSSPTISLTLSHTLHPRTNPEAAIFLPSSSHLVWTARDDHLLHYLSLPSPSSNSSTSASTLFEMTEYNLNPNKDSFTSFSILSLSLHPTLPLLSLQTSTSSARIFLYPFHSSVRLRTIHTGASQSDYFNPRHSFVPRSGEAVVVNSEDGIVRLCDLSGNGQERLKKGCHGIAAPLGDDEGEEEEEVGGLGDEVKSERAKARRERDRGSSVVRDVEVVEIEGEEGGWAILSAGFDKTVRMII